MRSWRTQRMADNKTLASAYRILQRHVSNPDDRGDMLQALLRVDIGPSFPDVIAGLLNLHLKVEDDIRHQPDGQERWIEAVLGLDPT